MNHYIEASTADHRKDGMKPLRSEMPSERSHNEIPVPQADNQEILRQFFEGEAEKLLGTLRVYVQKAGIAKGDSIKEVALEVLSEVFIEAIENADRFDPSRQPRAWLLGIAANLVKRKQTEMAKRTQREPLVRDWYEADGEALSDDEIFDRIASLTVGDAARNLESNEQAAAMLALVSEDDQQVLRLAILHELNGEELARALGISPGAARVRLHRALHRLRKACQ